MAFGLRLEEQHFAGARYIGIYSPLLLALTSMTLVLQERINLAHQFPDSEAKSRSSLFVAKDLLQRNCRHIQVLSK